MTETDLAYAAGIVDGEGCISIYRTRPRPSSRQNGDGFLMSVTVVNTSPLMARWLYERWGGSLSVKKRGQQHWKEALHWGLSAQQALRFLQALLPYLVVKRDHALNAMEFQSGMRQGGWSKTAVEHARQERCYWRSRQLNQKGMGFEMYINAMEVSA